jgi:hypothetical protein
MSLAESLMNAIAHGEIAHVQFKRGPTDERKTFDDLNKVIDRNKKYNDEVDRLTREGKNL